MALKQVIRSDLRGMPVERALVGKSQAGGLPSARTRTRRAGLGDTKGSLESRGALASSPLVLEHPSYLYLYLAGAEGAFSASAAPERCCRPGCGHGATAWGLAWPRPASAAVVGSASDELGVAGRRLRTRSATSTAALSNYRR